MSLAAATIEGIFQEHRKFLWSVSYRLTGNAADADDIVQETFIRAMKSPPAHTDEPWRPWLVRVAINLGRDLLRQRKRRGYDGQWLPSPIETDEEFALPSYDPDSITQGDPAARYDLLESVSFAFLLALEALTPAQRAILILRDVFDYSVLETAEALGLTEGNVKTTYHRARKTMENYDRSRLPLTQKLQAHTRDVLERFLRCLMNNDVVGAAKLLAADARQIGDGGGEFFAARKPIIGREKILLFNRHLQEKIAPQLKFTWRVVNGLPALVTEIPGVHAGFAPRFVMTCQLNASGQIERIYTVLATRKLAAIALI